MSDDEEESMNDWSKEVADVPFLVLSLEIPPTPLFKDSQGGNVIPQVPLFDVLSKYDGKKYTDILKAGYQQRKRYELLKLPPFIILHLSRFTKVCICIYIMYLTYALVLEIMDTTHLPFFHHLLLFLLILKL
jgi:hypothetical protein